MTLPPSGEPNFYLELGTSTTLKLYRFHVNFTTPSSSTFSGPVTITVASYSEACGGAGDCIPQPGGAPLLEGLGDRLMFPLSYRNFGDHESLVTNHSVAVGSSVGVRWYNIRSPNATPTRVSAGDLRPGLELPVDGKHQPEWEWKYLSWLQRFQFHLVSVHSGRMPGVH